jgi:hypothetical protein
MGTATKKKQHERNGKYNNTWTLIQKCQKQCSQQ